MIKLIAPLAKYAGLLFGGIVGWVSGFFGSESIKNLTWVMVAIAIIAAIFAVWYFLVKG